MSQEKDKKTMPKPAGTSAPKKLEAKVAKTQEAVEQYYATYEAKGLEYRDLLAKNEDKSAIFHAKYAVKVAKFYYKISKTKKTNFSDTLEIRTEIRYILFFFTKQRERERERLV